VSTPPDRERRWRAPGRVNLIGDHTDYQGGLCLPVAIDREVRVEFAVRSDGRVRLHSLGATADVDGVVAGDAPEWARFAAAVVRVLGTRGRPSIGIDADIESTVPVGAGLSSSAAFAVALGGALAAAAGWPCSGTELALAAQEAEHVGTGMPCGVMDQMASVHGRARHAVFLDCRSLAVDPIPLPDRLAIVVLHSGLPRALADSAYAARRAACEATGARLGLASLRDARLEQVAHDPIARHVVSENARVARFVDALRTGDLDGLGAIALESHRSLADDFAVSTPELDLLVDLAVANGAAGARLTGAGFGGCVVAFVEAARVDSMVGPIVDRYRAQTGRDATAFRVRAVDGAGPVS
jgi:galactokinase